MKSKITCENFKQYVNGKLEPCICDRKYKREHRRMKLFMRASKQFGSQKDPVDLQKALNQGRKLDQPKKGTK